MTAPQEFRENVDGCNQLSMNIQLHHQHQAPTCLFLVMFPQGPSASAKAENAGANGRLYVSKVTTEVFLIEDLTHLRE